ncbi:single-stranded DNA-binding protein [Agrobacterium radiobacter]|uniref:single-stranded DNA-binding protein n=1 Tax=Agrobacterium radiobacter TaxID=362 RepID=UPI00341BE11B
MSDLNQITITGRLGADAELRRTQDGRPIANLRVAVSETWRDSNSGERKEKTEWVTVVCFSEGLCKVIEQYTKKGSRVLIQGKLQTRKWQDQTGNDRYSTELVMQGFDAKLILLDSAKQEDRQDPARQENREPAPRQNNDQQGSFDRDLDDDIPF